MLEFLTSLLVLSPIVNRVVELFKSWLVSRFDIASETRTWMVLAAQVLIALVVFIGSYATAPIPTGTWLDRYPVIVIMMGIGLLALGSEIIYQVIDIAKALKGIGKDGGPPAP